MSTKPLSQADLLQRHQMLPSQPRVVALLASELRKSMLSMRKLAQLFSLDPVLAARLLATANAPELRNCHVRSIPEALMVVQSEQLRQLLQHAVSGGNFRATRGWSISSWSQYCQDVAKIARALAASVQANASAAYAMGLLYGLGELLIQTADPLTAARLAALMEPVHPGRASVEMKLIGYSSGSLVAGLSRSWHFPEAMCAAFQYLPAPLQQPVFDPLTGVVHLAVWTAATKHLQWSDRQLAVSFPAETGLALGIDIDMVLRQASIDWYEGGAPDLRI